MQIVVVLGLVHGPHVEGESRCVGAETVPGYFGGGLFLAVVGGREGGCGRYVGVSTRGSMLIL